MSDGNGAPPGRRKPGEKQSPSAEPSRTDEQKIGVAQNQAGEQKSGVAQQEQEAAGHGAAGRGTRNEQNEATYLQAISEAIAEEMRRDESVFIMGEDIADYGGAFKVTEGFLEEFGPERVRDTPISEQGFTGAGAGAALMGMRPIVEYQYADFISSAFDVIRNVISMYHYRTGRPVPMVMRGPSGGGVRAGPFHSQNPEATYAHFPGLKVLCPATPTDAKGLLKAAVRDDNPVMFLEHKGLYRKLREVVPDDMDFTVPIGKARVHREGSDVSVITYGAMVHRALEVAEILDEEDGLSIEVLDLRTIQPLDQGAILESVGKTSRAFLLQEDTRMLGIMSEVAAVLANEGFELLDAPVMRMTAPHVPPPFSPPLEDAFIPQTDAVVDSIRALVAY
jgi:2-oxoisovalerate dehydrogenase E1 component beta subunit